MTAEEPMRGVNLRKALEQAFGDDQPATTASMDCSAIRAANLRYMAEQADQLRIDVDEYEQLYPFEDPHTYEWWYGRSDPGWDR